MYSRRFVFFPSSIITTISIALCCAFHEWVFISNILFTNKNVLMHSSYTFNDSRQIARSTQCAITLRRCAARAKPAPAPYTIMPWNINNIWMWMWFSGCSPLVVYCEWSLEIGHTSIRHSSVRVLKKRIKKRSVCALTCPSPLSLAAASTSDTFL